MIDGRPVAYHPCGSGWCPVMSAVFKGHVAPDPARNGVFTVMTSS